MTTPDSSPRVISHRFRILSTAGSGGMGAVYRALDLESEQEVPLKLLRADGSPAQDTQRFLREAQFLAELHHPRLISTIECPNPLVDSTIRS